MRARVNQGFFPLPNLSDSPPESQHCKTLCPNTGVCAGAGRQHAGCRMQFSSRPPLPHSALPHPTPLPHPWHKAWNIRRRSHRLELARYSTSWRCARALEAYHAAGWDLGVTTGLTHGIAPREPASPSGPERHPETACSWKTLAVLSRNPLGPATLLYGPSAPVSQVSARKRAVLITERPVSLYWGTQRARVFCTAWSVPQDQVLQKGMRGTQTARLMLNSIPLCRATTSTI